MKRRSLFGKLFSGITALFVPIPAKAITYTNPGYETAMITADELRALWKKGFADFEKQYDAFEEIERQITFTVGEGFLPTEANAPRSESVFYPF
jgi:hypothetical protein